MGPETVPAPMANAMSTSLTPGEFERFVATLFSQTDGAVNDLRVTVQDRLRGEDGTYDIDVTVRYR